jgi:hypothetical protein
MEKQKIRELIERLADFRTRSEAMERLVQAGKDAVEPLTDALHRDIQEGAKWAVLRCLGEMQAEDAVEHIAPYLEDRHYKSVAHESLISIVGEDLGPAPYPWLRWKQQGGSTGGESRVFDPEMHMTGLPDERLMELALRRFGARWTAQSEGIYSVEVPVEGTEDATPLTVNLDQQDHEGSQIVIIYTDCGEARKGDYEYALHRNLRMPYGALAVRDSSNGPRFVMFNTLLREDMSPLELSKSAMAVAERAARVRRDLEEKAE